jgi:hypothetical protein
MPQGRDRVIVLFFLFFVLLAICYIPVMKIKNDNFPFTKVDTSSWNPDLLKEFEAPTEVGLLQNLMSFQGSDGDFSGTIRQYSEGFDNDRKLIILIHNDYTGDDSMGPFENKYTVKNINGKYKVIDFSNRYSCDRDLSFLSFFINPIWTNHACP